MKKSLSVFVLAVAVLIAATMLPAQRKEEASWAPKPQKPTLYTAPHKPHTKLAEVKAMNAGKKAWRYEVVDDDHLHAAYIQAPAGSKVARRFHPDTREWWVILDGRIRFEIEGQEPFVAVKGSMVQVPMQTIYSMETVGDLPSLRFEVNVAKAHTLYPKDTEPPKLPGVDWIPVTLNRKPVGYDHGNVPHINYYELTKAQTDWTKGLYQKRFIHDDRAVSNVLYGYEKYMAPLDPKNKGHYHAECAEFWLIVDGQVRYPIENHGVVIASEGDVVYVPPFTFHAPRFHGEKLACRLAMNGFTNIAHLFEAH
jgi:mannose-6-phosphate isomerase-like protein (cupin superfamily)